MQSSFPNSFALPSNPFQPVVKEKSKNYAWILHPVIDLLLVCGGLVWLMGGLMALGLLPSEPKGPFMKGTVIAALVLFGMPHQLQTYLRVFDSPNTRKTLAKPVIILGLICVALALLTCASPIGASLVGRFTLGFSFQHFYLQAFGLALLYCYKRGFYMSKLEKNTLMALCYAGTWSAVLMTFTRENLNIGGFDLVEIATIPMWVVNATDVCVVGLAVAFSVMMFKKWQKEKKVFPWPALLVLLSCFLFLGYLSRSASFVQIVILGQGLYHAPQYLVVTLAYHIKEKKNLELGVPNSEIWKLLWSPVSLKYLGFVLGGGWIMATVIGPFMPKVGIAAGFRPELAVCAYFCFINLHHYMVDGLIWKMKDKQTLQTLVA